MSFKLRGTFYPPKQTMNALQRTLFIFIFIAVPRGRGT